MRTSRARCLLKDKIKDLKELKNIRDGLKRKGKLVVFTNGCFDLLHYGHVKYLEAAKQKGDILIVAVNSDNSVRSIKGKNRPITGEEDRLAVVAALESVDYVVKFGEDTPLNIIKALKPDILVKGADWNRNKIVGADFIKNVGGSIARIKLLKGRSTTKLIKKIAKDF